MHDIIEIFRKGFNRLGKSGKVALCAYGFTLICLAGLDATALVLISKLITKTNEVVGVNAFQNEKSKIALVVSLFLFRSGASTVVSWFGSHVLAKQEVAIGQQNFHLLQNSSWAYRSKLNASDYTVAIDKGPFSLVQGVLLPGVTLFAETCTAVTILAVVMAYQPITAISTTVYFVLVSIAQHRLLSVKTQNAGKDILDSGKKTQELLIDASNLSKLISVMPTNSLGQSLLESRIKVALARARSDFLRALPRYFMESVLAFGFAVVAISAYLVSGSVGVISAITLFAAAGARLLPIVNRVQGILLQLFTEQPMASEALISIPSHLTSKKPKLINQKEQTEYDDKILIKLKDVSFSYPNSNENQLKNINFDFLIGKRYAIVGPSGAGKTTLGDLIIGVHEPSSGQIISLNDAMKIGYVPQETYIFNRSLKNNIALDWKNNQVQNSDYEYAIQMAQLENIHKKFHSNFFEGIENLDLSGGEKQRVGIARALYRKPDLLLLDEATSSLDADYESTIMGAIEKMHGNCTVITIAHRLSSIKRADTIIYVDAGSIVFYGTYEELIQNVPDFARQVRRSSVDAKL